MTLVAKSDHSTGNSKYCSYVLQSNDLVFAFTAPYSRKCCAAAPSSSEPLPDYDQQQAFDFVCTHGLAARAIGEHITGSTVVPTWCYSGSTQPSHCWFLFVHSGNIALMGEKLGVAAVSANPAAGWCGDCMRGKT